MHVIDRVMSPLEVEGESDPTSTSRGDSNPTSTSRGLSNPTSTSTGSITSAVLSTGAKIGIGVGVSFGVLGALIALALFWRHRRRQPLREVGATEFGTSANKAELPNEDLPRTHGRSELNEARAPVEMDATDQTMKAELAGADARVVELGHKEVESSTTQKSSGK